VKPQGSPWQLIQAGDVAIAGRITDRLTGSSVGGGGDSFVAKYDATGKEVFVRRWPRPPMTAANALLLRCRRVAAGGRTNILGDVICGDDAGATDAYLMKLSGSGYLEWVRSPVVPRATGRRVSP
jgi:hypothetical protein